MRFYTLSAGAAIISAALAAPVAPLVVPGVNITAASGDAAAIIPDSFIIQYKDGATAQDIASHRAQIQAKLNKAPEDTYSLPGFNAVHVKTNAAGLAKIGTHPAVSSLIFVTEDLLTPSFIDPPCRAKRENPTRSDHQQHLDSPQRQRWSNCRLSSPEPLVDMGSRPYFALLPWIL